MGSYASNVAYRIWSDQTPWSYWQTATDLVERRIEDAVRPGATIWLYDYWGHVDASADKPSWLLFLWPNGDRYDTSYFWADDLAWYWRHVPEQDNAGGNVVYIDGHAAFVRDYTDTFAPTGFYNDSVAVETWSLTGE